MEYVVGIMRCMEAGISIEAKNSQEALSIFINKHGDKWSHYYDVVYPHKNKVYVYNNANGPILECEPRDLLIALLGCAVDSYQRAGDER
jgi:hypothetical protein